MIVNKERIGIQFNFDEYDVDLFDFTTKRKDVEIQDQHLDLYFSRKELKKLNMEELRRGRINFALNILSKKLRYSSYSNIYTHVNTSKLSNDKPYLKEKVFENNQINVTKIIDPECYVRNFEGIIESTKVLNLIRKNPKMKIMDEFLKEVTNSKILDTHDFRLQVLYNDKEEWGMDHDDLSVCILVEEKEDSSK
ncbi:MAG: hypothetical protein AAF806_26365 [Bacteroidota bacterium]